MGHLAWLKQASEQCFAAGYELVLVAGYLLGHMDVFHKLAVVGVHRYLLGVVDVVDYQVAVGVGYHADVVAHAGGARLQVAQHAVLQYHADAVAQIHARVALHTLALDAHNLGGEKHAGEVDGIDTQVEQSASTQVGAHDAGLVAHAVAKGGGDKAGGADAAALRSSGFVIPMYII